MSLHLGKKKIQEDNNTIVQYAVDYIILQKNNKLGAEYEAHGNNDYEIDESDLYDIDDMIIY